MSSPSDALDGATPTVRRLLLTVEQTAHTLSVGNKTVRRLIDAGDLPIVRIGRSVRIAEADLATFVERHRER